MRSLELKVIETRLAQNRLELLDVVVLLEEVKRLRQENDSLQSELADQKAQSTEVQRVWDVYRGVANFPELAQVFQTLLHRMDHTAR